MKASMTCTFGVAAALAVMPFVHAAASAPSAGKQSKGEMRVITKAERPGGPQHRPALAGEKETVAFLGVEAAPASRTLAAQLALPAGAGLVVNHVVPDSPAAGVLQEHDVLLKLDDQLLIETRQLSVLIRQRKEGEEVTLTYLRGGKQATARVKLGKHEVPKFSGMFDSEPGAPLRAFAFGPGRFEFGGPERSREEVDRMLSLIRPLPHGAPDRIQMARPRGPGVHAMSIEMGNSNLVYSDDDGALELTIKDGVKTLVAKDSDGKELYNGPVNTPEERRKLPGKVRERLEKLEGMREFSFHTDEEFRGAQSRVFQPQPRGIGLPRPAAPVAPPSLRNL